jgi:pimeloyl-ACP methyl ester carboxylesterase
LPGFGQSPLPDCDPDLDVVVEEILGVLAERDVERVVVGGVSLGGYVTMALLRRRPSIVAGVLLCDTKATADGEDARANRERLAQLVLDSPEESGRILEQAVLPGLLGESTRASRPEVVERVRGWLHEADPRAVAWYQRAMAARPDSRGTLADVDPPTLVVWGEEDALSPRVEQDAMLEVLSDATLAAIAGAGHLANVEDPAAVTHALLGFLGIVRGPRHA